MTLPPSVLRALPPDGLGALRTIVAAGEACTADIVERWGAGRRFINAYGPTETTVCAMWGICEDGKDQPLIGRPLVNARVYVLDEHGLPSPIGVQGELHVGGVGVGRGYAGQGDLTAEKFIPNPYMGEPGERMYRTGDMARITGDGSIGYVGRKDEQVKVRGYRIELAEVEIALREHEQVSDAVVVARQEDAGETRLVAYVVENLNRRAGPEPDGVVRARISATELMEHLSSKLPGYMVPSTYVAMEGLPVTPNGKVDRKALPGPRRTEDGLDNYEGPCTPAERVLATIWAEVLGVGKIGIHDNFFSMGGDSILSIQVVSRAKRAGLVLSARQLFEHQTIAKLAAVAGSLEVVG
ncbi:MAG: non-ribosomal peptide synthetase, partial [Blastocatellia bacterium]